LDFNRRRDSAALFNSRFYGARPLAPDFIQCRDSAALFNSRFFGAALLKPDLFHYREPAPKKKYTPPPGSGVEPREPVAKIKIIFQILKKFSIRKFPIWKSNHNLNHLITIVIGNQ
jgi:hypothetical protein